MKKEQAIKEYFEAIKQSKSLESKFKRIFIPKRKPSFIIVGAQKAGTSSLFYYLSQHPKLIRSRIKEMHFFNKEENYKKGEKWYLNQLKPFNTSYKNGLLFEATPDYLTHEPSAHRIYTLDSTIKIIILLREPVSRAYSSWNMFLELYNWVKEYSKTASDISRKLKDPIFKALYSLREFPSFENIINEEINQFELNGSIKQPQIVHKGIYLPHVKRFHDIFGKDQVLILGFKELILDTKGTLNKILSFLNLPESEWEFLSLEIRNKGIYEENIKTKTKEYLEEYFKPYNKMLFEYLDEMVDW